MIFSERLCFVKLNLLDLNRLLPMVTRLDGRKFRAIINEFTISLKAVLIRSAAGSAFLIAVIHFYVAFSFTRTLICSVYFGCHKWQVSGYAAL